MNLFKSQASSQSLLKYLINLLLICAKLGQELELFKMFQSFMWYE